jgi:hypothetical protein
LPESGVIAFGRYVGMAEAVVGARPWLLEVGVESTMMVVPMYGDVVDCVTVAVGTICVTPGAVLALAVALAVALVEIGAGGGVNVVSGSDVSGIVELTPGSVAFCVIGMTVGGRVDSGTGGVVMSVGSDVGGRSVTVVFPIGVVEGSSGIVVEGPTGVLVISVPFVTGGGTTVEESTGGVVTVGELVSVATVDPGGVVGVGAVVSVALVTGAGTIRVEDGSVGTGARVTEGEVSTMEVVSRIDEIPVPEGIMVKERLIPESVGVGEGSCVGATDPESVGVGAVSVPF